MDEYWTVRWTEEGDACEIVAPGGEVVDTVTELELSTAKNPHEVMRYRIQRAQRANRAVRFGKLLRGEDV